MIDYNLLLQPASPDLTSVIIGLLVPVGTMLTVAGIAMRRMVDSHFDGVKDLRERATYLEQQENKFIRQVTVLEQQLKAAVRQREQENREHVSTIQVKEAEVARLQTQIDELNRQLTGLRTDMNRLSTDHDSVITERNTLRDRVSKQDEDIEELRKEIRSVVQAQSLDYELRRAYEQKLRDKGTDTKELQAIKDAVQRRLKGGQ